MDSNDLQLQLKLHEHIKVLSNAGLEYAIQLCKEELKRRKK